MAQASAEPAPTVGRRAAAVAFWAALAITGVALGGAGVEVAWRASQTPPGPAAAAPAEGEEERLRRLARSTLYALEHANATGDYAVFRALAARAFQIANPPEDLARTFADVRRQRLEVASATFERIEAARIRTGDGERRLVTIHGHLLSGGRRMALVLAYLEEDGDWRLDAIEVRAEPAPAHK